MEGHGLTFTIGRGNELCVQAINSLSSLVKGKILESFTSDMAGFWRMITGDSQFRWLGPDKGIIHLAVAAIVNAVWDLYAKVERKLVEIMKKIPLGNRMTTKEEIASMIVYLASEQASHITGHL